MKTKTKTLVAITVVTALGGTALTGVSLAGHRDGGFGMGILDTRHLAASAMQMFDAIDTDGDGTLTQAEIDAARNERLTAHDVNGDGNLDLEEFAELWQETTRPLTVRAFQMLDTDGDSVITRAESDQLFAGIVERLDRNRDGGLSMRGHRHDDDDDGGWWWNNR
ncbi:MAG: EF-hand domain-containing protein [Paracoccaceae bacterium]|nr:EF-hand domain-containing protein [Paracoccaceae bacterium]